MNNDLYLTDEDIHALDEPTWQEREIEGLKKRIIQLENKLEDAECTIELAIKYIKEHTVFIDYFLLGPKKVPKLELIDKEFMELIYILNNKENEG